MDKLRAICAIKGAFLRSEAVAAGCDDHALGRLRRAGVILRLRHGAYVFADAWEVMSPRERHGVRARAAYRCGDRPVALSHVSALLEHTATYWSLPLDTPHLTRLDGRTVGRAAGVHQHRGRTIDGDVVTIGDFQVMAPVRAALELTTVVGVEAALVSINDLLHSGLVTEAAIRERYARAIDHWPHTLSTNAVLHLMDRRIESAGESRTSYLLWSQGLPMPVPQYEVYDDAGGLVGVVDFAWPELGVFLEFDGKAKYQRFLREGEEPGDAVFREKKREDRLRQATGWRCIRITWADLEHPVRTAAMIRRVLAHAA